MKVLKFNELNTSEYIFHITEDIYAKIANEIDEDSYGEENYSNEIIVDIDDEYDIFIEYKVSREYVDVEGGSDEYGNPEIITELLDVSLLIESATVYNKDTGDEQPSDVDSDKLEELFEKENS